MLIGDVVGLGKTIMAVAVARMMDETHGFETLIICPKNLLPMWEDYCRHYHVRAKVLSLSRVTLDLPQIRRFRIVLIDESHNLRNFVYLYAIEHQLELSIGTQEDFINRATTIYQLYAGTYKKRFQWLSAHLFVPALAHDLKRDAHSLFAVILAAGEWNPQLDHKVNRLVDVLQNKHPHHKVLIFSQFADTVSYLQHCLTAAGITRVAAVTGACPDPAAYAWAFSPVGSGKRAEISPADELRVLIATDVLSEGQNLQDCAIVINYDLPWAIIRLIQRVGRVDRIGQKAAQILCYSFLPADGVERIIRLRTRIRKRLQENAEVVGTDEEFFEEERQNRLVLDIYNENAGILDNETDGEVDLASYAYQIWKNAITQDPALEQIIPNLQPVVYSTCAAPVNTGMDGVLVYLRTGQENDALVWLDKNGTSITESQKTILDTARCLPETPAQVPLENHHELVGLGVKLVLREETLKGGQLGRPSGARFRTYERLKQYMREIRGSKAEPPDLEWVIDDIYNHPLRQTAADTINRQLKNHITDEDLAQLVIALKKEDRLCIIHNEVQKKEPQIMCSMGLKGGK